VLRAPGPLALAPAAKVAVLVDDTAPHMIASGEEESLPLLHDALAQHWPDADISVFHIPRESGSSEVLHDQLRKWDVVCAGVNGANNPDYLALVKRLADSEAATVVFLMRSPYDAALVPNAPYLAALYEDTPWMMQAAVEAVMRGGGGGRLPVFVSSAFPEGAGIGTA
jgi:beta-N-acetylhexosaminidase